MELQGAGAKDVGNVLAHTARSLNVGAAHMFRIRAKSSVGLGEWSAWVEGATDPTVRAKLAFIRVTSATID